MTDREHLALLESFMNAFNAHDAEALMRCMTEDCLFHTAAGPEPGSERQLTVVRPLAVFAPPSAITIPRWLPAGTVTV